MPELPEVESVRRTIKPLIINKKIIQVQCADYPRIFKPSPRGLADGLMGRKILKVGRKGKLLILSLSKGAFLTIHLGMTGQLICAAQKPDADHIHMAANLGKTTLFFRDPRRFGGLAFYPTEQELNVTLRKMGEDALKISDALFCQAMQKRRIPIKAALLNQAIVAGVGNIYADEGLHMAGISPFRPAAELTRPELSRLNRALKEVMLKSLAMGGSSVKNFVDANGRPGTFQETHRVYQRAGRACPVCGATIDKTVLGGRSTHFCGHCQP